MKKMKKAFALILMMAMLLQTGICVEAAEQSTQDTQENNSGITAEEVTVTAGEADTEEDTEKDTEDDITDTESREADTESVKSDSIADENGLEDTLTGSGETASEEEITDEECEEIAKAEKVTYTIKLYPCNGTSKTYQRKVTEGDQYGKTAKLPVLKRKNYVFAGWYTAKSGGKKITDHTVVSKNGVKYLYGQWKYIPKVTLSTTKYTYNGKVKKPAVIAKNSSGKRINSSYYNVSYSKGRKAVGRYSVKVTFKGKYAGTITKYFKIYPKSTSISTLSEGGAAFTAKWKKQSSQTSGYQIQCSTSKNYKSSVKTTTVSSTKTITKSVSKLRGNKTYYVRIRTYKKVKINGKSAKLYSGWSKTKSVRTLYKMPSGNGVLTKSKGVNYYRGRRETWYSQRVLAGNGLTIPGRHIGDDGTVRDKNNYICVASSDYRKGTVIRISLGLAKVYDAGCASGTVDVYTDW